MCNVDKFRDMHQVLKALLSRSEVSNALFEAVRNPWCRKEVNEEDECQKDELAEDVQIGVPVVETG